MFAYIFIVYILQENDSCLFKIFIHFFNLTCAKKQSIINHCIMPFHLHQNILFNSLHNGTKVPLWIVSIAGHKCPTMRCPLFLEHFKFGLSNLDLIINSAVCLQFRKMQLFVYIFRRIRTGFYF